MESVVCLLVSYVCLEWERRAAGGPTELVAMGTKKKTNNRAESVWYGPVDLSEKPELARLLLEDS